MLYMKLNVRLIHIYKKKICWNTSVQGQYYGIKASIPHKLITKEERLVKTMLLYRVWFEKDNNPSNQFKKCWIICDFFFLLFFTKLFPLINAPYNY